MDWTIVQGGLCERGACSEWASAFPLLLNKALAAVKKHGLGVCTRWTLLGHVQSGPVGFPLLLNKALQWGQET